MPRSILNRWLPLALCWVAFASASAQTTQEEFGTNRVQYKDFTWQFYTTDRYSVYFYLGGQELGKFVAMDAEGQIERVEKLLEYRLQDPVDIMVYNNIEDLKQSNIGRYQELNNTGGVTRVIGNKIFLYFDGNHEHLQRQLRNGIAGLCLKNMLFGGSIQDVLQNAVLLNLPDWYSNGLAAYAGESWNPELDAALRDNITTGKYKNLNKLAAGDAVLAGHSFWHYIAQQYGESTIANILYLTRINHGIEAGFTFVINKSLRQVIQDWYNYYNNYYKTQPQPPSLQNENMRIALRARKDRVYSNITVNAPLDKTAYVVNRIGLYQLRIQNNDTHRSKKILHGGYRDQTMPVDYNSPLIAWDPTGKTLAAFYSKRANIYLFTYDTETKKKTRTRIANFQKVVSMAFGETPNQLVLSAINRGQSDIYTFNISSGSIKQITNDTWDDLDPQFVKLNNRQGIVFLSNRLSDTLRNNAKAVDTLQPMKPLDVYFYNTKTQSKALVQVTNTPDASEASPIPYNPTHFGYLTVRNHVYNRNVAYIDSVLHHYDHYYYFPDSTVINPKYNFDSLQRVGQWKPDSVKQVPVYKDVAHSFADTDYKMSMNGQSKPQRSNYVIEEYTVGGKPVLAKAPVHETIEHENELPFVPKPESDSTRHANRDTSKAKADTVDIDNYIFQSEFTQPRPKHVTDTSVANKTVKPFESSSVNPSLNTARAQYHPSHVLPYNVQFANDYLVSQLDNSLIVNRYQSYAANGGQYQNPQLGGLIKLGITDLFEDYRISGGFRLPTNITGTEYFMTLEDYKKRLDKKYTFYRHVRNETYDLGWIQPVNGKVKTNYAEASLRYPLDYNRSLRGVLSYRQEKVVFQSKDTFSLNLPDYTENWAAVRLEYVFDNTLKIQYNILNGTRYKLYTDIQKLLDKKKFFTYAAGIDFRHYERVHRQIVWATRVNAATSWGSARIAYLLGGVDNWIFPKVAQDPNSTDQTSYAFMSLATNVRGFPESTRKGNSVALVNTELRVPVFSYLSNAPIKSEFIKNFQLVGFVDAGTAWLGLSPYSQDNPFNTKIFTRPPVTVKVNYFREPVILGTGVGARTTLFGYFIRVDYARGLDSGEWQKPIWHVSLGTDF